MLHQCHAISPYTPDSRNIHFICPRKWRNNGFTFHSAFWIFNLVANWAYTRYDIIYPEVRAKIDEIEYKFISQIPEIDAKAIVKY